MYADNQKSSDTPTLPVAAVSALQLGNKIEAIKIVRKERQIGLKAAKGTVEDYVRNQPFLQESFAAAQAKTKRSALLLLAVVIASALLAYWFSIKS